MVRDDSDGARVQPRLQVMQAILEPLNSLRVEDLAPLLASVAGRTAGGAADPVVGIRKAVAQLIGLCIALAGSPQLLVDLNVASRQSGAKIRAVLGLRSCPGLRDERIKCVRALRQLWFSGNSVSIWGGSRSSSTKA